MVWAGETFVKLRCKFLARKADALIIDVSGYIVRISQDFKIFI